MATTTPRFLTPKQIQALLNHPKCIDLACQLGHMPYNVIMDERMGPSICTPFFKSFHILQYIEQQWETRLDHYQELLDNAHTLEGLWNLRFYTERAYRPYVMRHLHQELLYDPLQFDRGGWWELLMDLWTDSEAIHCEKERDFAYLFRLVPTTKKLTQALPKGRFKVFRGGHPGGDSWTLDRNKATWFAGRFGKAHGVHEQWITKQNALFYTNERSEQEVLLKTILDKETAQCQ